MARSDKFIPSEKDLEQIQTMAGLGMTMPDMAAIFNVDKKTLERRIAEDGGDNPIAVAIEQGRAIAKSKVTESLFNLATKKNNLGACIFWLKCRAGWREENNIEIDQKITLIYQGMKNAEPIQGNREKAGCDNIPIETDRKQEPQKNPGT